MLTCGSPRLIAAYRVLRRQSVPWHPPCALVRLILPVHIVYPFLRLLRGINNLDCLFCFFPVQFSRCVEVSTFQSILQNDTEIIILSPVKFRRWLRWPTIIFGTFAPLLPVFPAPSLRFQSVDLGYDPISSDHFSLERR